MAKKKNNSNEDIIEFHRNFVIKILSRDLVTGNIYEKYLPNKEIIVSKIDELYLNKTDLLKSDTQYHYDGTDLFRYEETNLGYHLVGKFVKDIIHPIQYDEIISKVDNIVNENFYYLKPKYLLKRKKDGYNSFEKFNDEK